MVMEVVQEIERTPREEFSDLAREHHRELLVYARTLTREDTVAWDLVQDAFVVAWHNMGKFDVTGNFASWMRGIVRNKWREWLRARRRLVPLELDAMEELEATMKTWDELRQDGGPTVFGKLEDCLAKLPEPLAAAQPGPDVGLPAASSGSPRAGQ